MKKGENMNIPKNLKYTKSHEWVKFDGETTATVGLTDYAQSELGDLVFVNLPEAGDTVTAGEAFSDVESVKAVSDVYAPVTGTVEEANAELMDAPEKINADPYEAWLVKIEDITSMEELLTAEEYEKFVEEEKAQKH
jgi:glycine cleavage system H protein